MTPNDVADFMQQDEEASEYRKIARQREPPKVLRHVRGSYKAAVRFPDLSGMLLQQRDGLCLNLRISRRDENGKTFHDLPLPRACNGQAQHRGKCEDLSRRTFGRGPQAFSGLLS